MKCNVNDAEGKTLRKNVYIPNSETILYYKNNILSKEEIKELLDYGIKEIDVEKEKDISSFPELIDEKIYECLKTINFSLLDEIVELYEEIIDSSDNLRNDMTIYVKTKRDEITPKLLTVLNTNFAVTIGHEYNKSHPKKEKINIRNLIKVCLTQDIGLICSTNKLYLDNLSSKYDEDIKLLKKKYPNINEDALFEYDINMHPVYSYYMAKTNNLDDDICEAILLHEENFKIEENQKSSPLDISLNEYENNDVSLIASIIKAVDSYNRLLFALFNQNKDYPFISLTKHLDKMVANGILSPEIVKLIKYYIPIYQMDSRVLLSDGTIGKVSEINPNNMSLPKLVDLNGNDIKEDEVTIVYPL